MLIKEYRILFPMSVEEYKIGQLYMIQKSSRIESGNDSGVEIITNEPYDNGPNDAGQYTYKIYHLGNRVPSWIKNVLPSTALQANEEAWNAYPFTRTRYSSPLLDRFSIEIETLYFNDAGTQENVFNLKDNELKQRVVDVMDFVNEQHGHDYCEDEDPKLYKSKKTGRGPLSENWINEYIESGKPLMCAYKLCKVEFRYWGMQTRVERWIHDLVLRGFLLKSHVRAWAWQDEWVDLTMADIRKLEEEAALYLSKVMSNTKSIENLHKSDSSSDIFFDCYDTSPVEAHKPSLVRWSSELLVNDEDSPPLTPKLPNSSLLIIVFHGDVYPEAPADSKTTDSLTLKATLDVLVQNHYPQLKDRVHVLRVTCGSELAPVVSSLSALSPSFGAFHPSLALLLASGRQLDDAVYGTIAKANKAIENFYKSPAGQNFSGEIFTVGDCIGGILMYEALRIRSHEDDHPPISRHSSSLSSNSRAIPEGQEETWPINQIDHNLIRGSRLTNSSSSRNSSAPPMSAPPPTSFVPKKKMSTSSFDGPNLLEINSNVPSFRLNMDGKNEPRLAFRPSTSFLLGCPLALILTQRKLNDSDIDALECNQLFNLFYSLDTCGARLEPVLNSQLSLLPVVNVPRYHRFPLGDGKHLLFDQATSLCDCATLWGTRRVDHQLYCPQEMVSLPSSALPNILHASYWESEDVGAFILRQFVRTDETHASASFSTSGAMNCPLKLDVPPAHWTRKRTRFKVANLSANHRANDIIVVEGTEQVIHAKFCYGPMDLVALSQYTDSHGKLTVNLKQQLPIGIHTVKMIVGGDHSFLDMYIAVVPPETRCVVFSIDGSLTGSVSVTGRDPRVRPGAVDVVRYWQQHGYLIIYVTARPDMQQKVVGAWLAQHNFPHGLLFFTPSISTDPLRQKTLHLKYLKDMGIIIHAAYGSSKDVTVYSNAGIEQDRIFSVSGGKRRGCVALEDGYAQHLHDLHAGRVSVAQPAVTSSLIIGSSYFTPSNQQNATRLVQRTHSFTPRSGKFDNLDSHGKKHSQMSIPSTK
uniref:DDHD domain-containing protein n=1 Tax=Panagrolaimus sp. JU765 TaxID=591449 RepID=A0AC34RFZ1_9BILA